MKKLNKEIILRIIILVCFALFYFSILINGKVLLYVHPRIKPFIIISMVAMVIIALFLIKEGNNKRRGKVKLYSYGIYLIPIVLGAFINSVEIDSTTVKSTEISSPKLSDGLTDNTSLYEIQGDSSGKKIKIEDNVIKITTDNFISSLEEILNNPNKYAEKDIEIQGFVYKDDTIHENQFVVGKLMMTCCAADTQIVGLLAEYDGAKNFDNDTWVKVKGKLAVGVYSGDQEIVIAVESLERDNDPDKNYVYPY